VPLLRKALFGAAGESRWDQRAARVLDEDLSRAHRSMTIALLTAGGENEPLEALLRKVSRDRAEELASYRSVLEDISTDEAPTLPAMMVAIRELGAQRRG
jgi:NAD-specific glutamate dehydrogenase